MSYSLNKRSLIRVKALLDEILQSTQQLVTIDTENPKQTRFYINQGMNYVYEHEIKPYDSLLIKLTIKDGKLIAEKKNVLGIAADLTDINAKTFGDIVWLVSQSILNTFSFPNVVITEEELEFFNQWKTFNNLGGDGKKLWREKT